MRHLHNMFAAAVVTFFVLAGAVACSPDDPWGQKDEEQQGDVIDDPTADDNPSGGNNNNSTVIDDNDAEDALNLSDFPTTITITWSGTSATVSGADNKISCTVSGGHVTLGSSDSAVEGLNIVLKGTSTDGALKLYNQKKTLLTLSGVTLTSKTGAVINSQCKKRVFIYTPSGTTSTLADASSYSDVPSEEDCKGTIFSEGQIILAGSGTINLKGCCKHAIASDDYIRQLGGTVKVTASATDGLHIKDYFRMDDGTLDITSSGDGIDVDEGYVNIVGGTIKVTSVGDGIKTSYDGTDTSVSDYVNVAGGTLNITTTGSKGQGIKAVSDVIVSGGSITASVSGAGSKAIKAGNNVAISGGIFNLTTTGTSFYDTDDKDTCSPCCIRAENAITIDGGEITAKSTGLGGKGLNCYEFTMNKGTVSATTTGRTYSYSNKYTCKPKAIKATNLVTINGGTIDVLTTGTEGEGIESKGNIIVVDGDIHVQAYDDGINCSGVYSQRGGNVFVYSTNNDALDSNYGKQGAIYISGGVVMAHGTSAPEEGIDADNNSYIVIAGGTVFSSGGQQGGGGGMGMGGTSSGPSCAQPAFYLQNVSLSTGYFTVCDSDGKVVMSCYIPRGMSQDYSLVSSSAFKSGSTYTYGIVSSAPSSPTTSWGTYYYSGGTVSGSLSGSYTASTGYSTIGSSSGSTGGGMGGGGGMNPGGGGMGGR